MDALARLFGSPARLKLMRFFLFNHDVELPLADLAERLKLSKKTVRTELGVLTKSGLVRKKSNKNGAVVYQTSTQFEYFEPLEAFIRRTTATPEKDILVMLKKTGALRLVVLSGFFSGVTESSVDLLIVGDHINERALARTIHTIEAELGREVRYAPFTTADFRYRLGVYDRLIRDVMDYPHQTLLDKIGL